MCWPRPIFQLCRQVSGLPFDWAIRFMRKAQIAGKRVQFIFERPPGIRVSASGAGATQTAYVVCGVPR